MTNKPYVFIDIDGVFNRYTFDEGHCNQNLDDELLACFASVVKQCDADVVSLSPFNICRLRERMAEHGIRYVVDYHESGNRSKAIFEYIGENGYANFAVVDDEAIPRWEYYERIPDRLIKVDGRVGFSDEDAHDLLLTLNPSTFWQQSTVNCLKNAHKLIETQKRYIKRLEEENKALKS